MILIVGAVESVNNLSINRLNFAIFLWGILDGFWWKLASKTSCLSTVFNTFGSIGVILVYNVAQFMLSIFRSVNNIKHRASPLSR